MITYISILRGINVSGHRLIKMQDLKNLLSDLHFKNITTYIQSGNIVFEYDETDSKKISKQIETIIKKKYEFEVPVITLTANELQQAHKTNPFLKQNNVDAEKLHITFLSDVPEKSNSDKISEQDYYPDQFYVINKQVYLYCPNGYGNTKLNNTFFEKKLQVSATTRNLKTVKELIKIVQDTL